MAKVSVQVRFEVVTEAAGSAEGHRAQVIDLVNGALAPSPYVLSSLSANAYTIPSEPTVPEPDES